MNLRAFAYEILNLVDEVEHLRAENERLKGWQKKHDDLVMDDIRHGEKMMGGWMALLLDNRIKIESNAPAQDGDK